MRVYLWRSLCCAVLLWPAASRAEVNELRIPLGAGGVGFLPYLVMEKQGLIERDWKRIRPSARGQRFLNELLELFLR